ncbi:phosphodiesterase [Kitasatospora sp. NPDC056138]|uniref:phosphodiesterase n=1 Tax=Kitasatospora sp. NPDC056138 TaxID=3345724 RepID=UPI0035DB621E
MLVLAQVSDVHLGQDREGDGGERAAARTARVMDYLNGLPGELDAVLVTGDIADQGLPAEYETAAKLLDSRHTVLTCPGNHDVREAYRAGLLGEEAAGGPVNRVHELPGATVLMCDSSIPGRHDGLLDDETLDWMDRQLAARPEVPALVAFHHPPVALHVPYVDEIRQFGEERLAELLGRHPRVVALLCGHSHTPAATTFAGLPLLVAPGVVSTVNLPWEEGGTVTFDHPPMVAFHVLDDERRLTTHYRPVV